MTNYTLRDHIITLQGMHCLGRSISSKKPKLRRFKSDQDEILQVNTHQLTHSFNMAAMTSLHATTCCHRVSEYEMFAGAYICSSVRHAVPAHSAAASAWRSQQI